MFYAVAINGTADTRDWVSDYNLVYSLHGEILKGKVVIPV